MQKSERCAVRSIHAVAELQFGVAMFPTDYAIDPVALGRLAEERGFESLWVPEHTHIPASRATPYPAGGDLPEMYWRTHDPFVALAAVAATTERLKVGTGICLVVERDPITTAKEVASLDQLSGGRFLFGVGAGWNREEMENHGTDPDRRFGLMRERIEAMKAIWTEDEAEYHGRHEPGDLVVRRVRAPARRERDVHRRCLELERPAVEHDRHRVPARPCELRQPLGERRNGTRAVAPPAIRARTDHIHTVYQPPWHPGIIPSADDPGVVGSYPWVGASTR